MKLIVGAATDATNVSGPAQQPANGSPEEQIRYAALSARSTVDIIVTWHDQDKDKHDPEKQPTQECKAVGRLHCRWCTRYVMYERRSEAAWKVQMSRPE